MAQTRKIIKVIAALAVVALVITYKANPGLFSIKRLGSFELVRKGEALLDKGNNKEAITCFERAHEASPENNDIRDALAWAYTRYGQLLGRGAKHYEEAISYLRKAFELKRDSATAQNLAFMYTRKAGFQVHIGRGKEDWAAILSDLEEARSVSSRFGDASKNLAIMLYNTATEEYKKGRMKMALVWLVESSAMHDDSRIPELIGDIYYKSRRLERASDYWNEAKRLNPEDKGLSEKLEKIAKEIELGKLEVKGELPHFDIIYEKGLGVDTQAVSRMLEKAYFDVGRNLNYYIPSRTKVFFYSQDNFKAIFKLPGIVRAFYDGNIRMPYPQASLDEETLRRYLYHEYAHAVVSAASNNSCPVWFSEGVATWEEEKDRDDEVRRALSGRQDYELSISFLNDGFTKADILTSDIRIHYLLSYTAIKFIIATWGVHSLRYIIQRLSGGQHLINAIDDEFLLPEKEFNRRWEEYVRSKYLNEGGKNGKVN